MRLSYLRSALCLLAPAGLITGCADDSSQDSDAGGSTGPMITSITAADTDDESSGTGDDDDDDVVDGTTGDDDDDETGDPDACQTILCGDPSVCCDEGDECIVGQCLPACDSEIRCGENFETCCDEGQVCLQPECVSPGDPCIDSFDCPEDEFCEPTLGQCLPQQEPVACEIIPEFEDVEIDFEWSIVGIDMNDVDDITDDTACEGGVGCDPVESLSMPAVGDVDGDGLPEVVLNTWDAIDPDDGNAEFYGHIIVLAGETGEVQFRIMEDPDNGRWGSYARSTIGLADMDDDGLPDIVYSGRPRVNVDPFPNNTSLVYAVNGLGQPIWVSHDALGDPHYLYIRHGSPSFANFDSDDASEVVFGAAIIDNDGLVVSDDDAHPSGLGDAVYGSNGNYWGGLSAIADLDQDGDQEIISGKEAWEVSWNEIAGMPVVTKTRLWDEGLTDTYADGYPAIADLDGDGNPEVVLVGEGMLSILEADTGVYWCGIDADESDCGDPADRTQPILLSGDDATRGGPPTIADFDNDGRPEIGVAGSNSYTVFDINRDGEDVVQPGGFPVPDDGEIFVKWSNTTQDNSSKTGSSLFDFQGDGIAEVVYSDECYLRVYSGDDGDIILEVENSSATVHEYPIVVDVDDDGNSELLVVANDQNVENNCLEEDYEPRVGLFVYGDPNDQWVRTRQVWNSHTYHVTNSTSTGLHPVVEDPNWLDGSLNNYRQNVQGEGIYNAADVNVDLTVATDNCLEDEFEVIATVRNNGSLGVPEGIPVSLYLGVDTSGELVGTQETAVPLLPGAQTQISWLVPAPGEEALDLFVFVDNDNGDGEAGVLIECDEENQTAAATSVSCSTPG